MNKQFIIGKIEKTTDKAIFVQVREFYLYGDEVTFFNDGKKWFPLSQVEISYNHLDNVIIEVPEWLLKKNKVTAIYDKELIEEIIALLEEQGISTL